MTKSELQAKQELESKGWTLLRNGWPDFLGFRVDSATGEFTIRPIEIKQKQRTLRGDQKKVSELLSKIGLPVVIYNPGDESVEYSMLSIGDRIKRKLAARKAEGYKLGRSRSQADVSEIVKDRESGMTFTKIAAKHGISASTACRIMKDLSK